MKHFTQSGAIDLTDLIKTGNIIITGGNGIDITSSGVPLNTFDITLNAGLSNLNNVTTGTGTGIETFLKSDGYGNWGETTITIADIAQLSVGTATGQQLVWNNTTGKYEAQTINLNTYLTTISPTTNSFIYYDGTNWSSISYNDFLSLLKKNQLKYSDFTITSCTNTSSSQDLENKKATFLSSELAEGDVLEFEAHFDLVGTLTDEGRTIRILLNSTVIGLLSIKVTSLTKYVTVKGTLGVYDKSGSTYIKCKFSNILGYTPVVVYDNLVVDIPFNTLTTNYIVPNVTTDNGGTGDIKCNYMKINYLTKN